MRTDFFHLHCGMCGCPIVEVYRITGNSYGFFSPLLFSSRHTLGASSHTSAVILGRGCHCANEASPIFIDTHAQTVQVRGQTQTLRANHFMDKHVLTLDIFSSSCQKKAILI